MRGRVAVMHPYDIFLTPWISATPLYFKKVPSLKPPLRLHLRHQSQSEVDFYLLVHQSWCKNSKHILNGGI